VLRKSLRQSLYRFKREASDAFQLPWNKQSGIDGNAHPVRELKQL
jgi:hypothetical protein